MTTIDAAAIETIEQFKALGINAVIDPRDLEAPGLLLMPQSIQLNRLDRATLSIQWECWIVAPDSDPWPHLSQMVEKLSGHVGINRFDAISVNAPNLSPDPLPALTFNIEMEYK